MNDVVSQRQLFYVYLHTIDSALDWAMDFGQYGMDIF